MNITGANQFLPSVYRRAAEGCDVVISGTFVGTVTVQVSKDNITWYDAGSSTVPDVLPTLAYTAWYIRAGIKTGNYTSGTAVVDIY